MPKICALGVGGGGRLSLGLAIDQGLLWLFFPWLPAAGSAPATATATGRFPLGDRCVVRSLSWPRPSSVGQSLAGTAHPPQHRWLMAWVSLFRAIDCGAFRSMALQREAPHTHHSATSWVAWESLCGLQPGIEKVI